MLSPIPTPYCMCHIDVVEAMLSLLQMHDATYLVVTDDGKAVRAFRYDHAGTIATPRVHYSIELRSSDDGYSAPIARILLDERIDISREKYA